MLRRRLRKATKLNRRFREGGDKLPTVDELLRFNKSCQRDADELPPRDGRYDGWTIRDFQAMIHLSEQVEAAVQEFCGWCKVLAKQGED
jgi:hypothetical protein